jgi:hypothetical protein
VGAVKQSDAAIQRAVFEHFKIRMRRVFLLFIRLMANIAGQSKRRYSRASECAACPICERVDAVLERDERRRRDYPDSPTDAYLLRAIWIEHRSMRAIARETGRHRKRIQDRIDAALAALTTTLGELAAPATLRFYLKNRLL